MASTRSHQWALTARWNLVEVKKSIFLFNHSDGWQLVHAGRCTLTTHHVVGYNSTQAHIKHQPSNTTPVTLIPEEDWRWELALSLYTHTSSTSPFNFDVVFFSQIHPTPSTRADWRYHTPIQASGRGGDTTIIKLRNMWSCLDLPRFDLDPTCHRNWAIMCGQIEGRGSICSISPLYQEQDCMEPLAYCLWNWEALWACPSSESAVESLLL